MKKLIALILFTVSIYAVAAPCGQVIEISPDNRWNNGDEGVMLVLYDKSNGKRDASTLVGKGYMSIMLQAKNNGDTVCLHECAVPDADERYCSYFTSFTIR